MAVKNVKKSVKKKSAKKKPRATMSQSVRQTVIVNPAVATRKRKSKAKPKAKSKSDSEIIASLVDKFVNLSAEQAKINNTITETKQTVKVEDKPSVKSAPVSKINGLGDLESKKVKKAEPIEPPIPKPDSLKRATSSNTTLGNIFSHLGRKPPPKPPPLFGIPASSAQKPLSRDPSLDTLPVGFNHKPEPLLTSTGLGKGGPKRAAEESKKDDYVMVDPLSTALSSAAVSSEGLLASRLRSARDFGVPI